MTLPDDIGAERIGSLLETDRYGRSLDVREVTGSTMDDAREAAAAGAADGHVVLADRQESGRGSHGRAWSSPGGEDLYLSIVSRPGLHRLATAGQVEPRRHQAGECR